MASGLNLCQNTMKESYGEEVPEIHAATAGKVAPYCFVCWSMLPSRNKKTKKKPGPSAAERWARARRRGIAGVDRSLQSGAIDQRKVVFHSSMASKETEHHYLERNGSQKGVQLGLIVIITDREEPRMRTQWMTSEQLRTRQRPGKKYIQFQVLNFEHGGTMRSLGPVNRQLNESGNLRTGSLSVDPDTRRAKGKLLRRLFYI
ncbi:hypothetical protein IW262DRAFT_1557440 [Armillaria fumosa]|nr:hypothetical protein IW262DRAFT_1557440 [Armillaria fumosa]